MLVALICPSVSIGVEMFSVMLLPCCEITYSDIAVVPGPTF